MKARTFAVFLIALAAARDARSDRSANLYEWLAVAPIVVIGDVEVDDQRYVAIRVERVLRGNLETGSVAFIDQRGANRDRPDGSPKLELEKGRGYLFLLEPSPRAARSVAPLFDLSRGTAGARALGEGGTLLAAAAARMVVWQDRRSERQLWADLSSALGDPNPVLVETALDLFLKFRRAAPEVLPALRVLLAAPRADFREKAATLVGQAVSPEPGEPSPAIQDAVVALIAAARRDDAVAVRVAATRALGGMDGAAPIEALQEIARSDPEQAVRYEAQRSLVDRRPEPRDRRD